MSFSIKPRSLSLSKVLGLSGPPSPTFSDATTHASAISFGADGPAKIITRSNLKASVQAYEDVSIVKCRGRVLIPRSSSQRAQTIARLWCPCQKRRLVSPMPWSAAARASHLFCSEWMVHNPLIFRLKGPSYETGTRLQAAAGVHHLIGNLWHVLVSAPVSPELALCSPAF